MLTRIFKRATRLRTRTATRCGTRPVAAFKPVRRLFYDSDSDAMYLAGDVEEQNWGSFLRVKNFTDWSKGNRTASYTTLAPKDER